MEKISTVFQSAYNFLNSLFVRQDFEEVDSSLDRECTMLGPCDGEFLNDRKTICAYFEDVLTNLGTCTISNEKCEVATQSATQIVLMLSYTLEYKIEEREFVRMDQHCTMIIEKETQLVVHLNFSDTVESIMQRGSSLNEEFVSQSENAIYSLLEQKNEIINMINSNTRCGLKGSNNDDTFSFYYVNEGLYRMLGYTYDEFMEMSQGSAVGMVYPPDLQQALDSVARCFSCRDDYSAEYRIRKKDGSFMWVIDSGRRHTTKNGVIQINSILMDITETKQSQINLQVERERYRLALENITDVMFEYDALKDEMLKYVREDNNRNNPVEEVRIPRYLEYIENDHYIHLDDIGILKEMLLGTLNRKTMNIRLYQKHLGWRWVKLQCSHIYEDGKAVKCIGIWKDITDEKSNMERLIDLSQRDPLTNLYHLNAVEKDIQNIIDKEGHCSMIIMDIDNFKSVNDTYGHLKGNDALTQVKDILLKVCKDIEYVCRIGGDEFMVFLSSKDSDKTQKYADDILNEVRKISIHEVTVTLSIGVAYAKPKEAFNVLFKEADEAMYKAKKQGRNCVEIAK